MTRLPLRTNCLHSRSFHNLISALIHSTWWDSRSLDMANIVCHHNMGSLYWKLSWHILCPVILVTMAATLGRRLKLNDGQKGLVSTRMAIGSSIVMVNCWVRRGWYAMCHDDDMEHVCWQGEGLMSHPVSALITLSPILGLTWAGVNIEWQGHPANTVTPHTFWAYSPGWMES